MSRLENLQQKLLKQFQGFYGGASGTQQTKRSINSLLEQLKQLLRVISLFQSSFFRDIVRITLPQKLMFMIYIEYESDFDYNYTLMGNQESQPKKDVQPSSIEDRIEQARKHEKSNFKKSYQMIRDIYRSMQEFGGEQTTLIDSSFKQDKDQYWSLLGGCYYKLLKFQQSLDILNAILQNYPNSTKHLKEAGDCERHLQRYQKSHLRYNEAQLSLQFIHRGDIKFKRAEINNSWGLSYLAEGKFKQACQKFQKAISTDVQNPLYYCHAGAAYSARGMRQQAIQRYQKALDIMTKKSEEHLLTFLSKNNIKYVKSTLNAFVKQLISLFEKNTTEDETMKERVNRFGLIPVQVSQNMEMNTPFKQNELRHKLLSEAQEKMAVIEENQLLREFYSGLYGSFQQQRAQAGILKSKVIMKDTSSIIGHILSNIVFFFFGPIAAFAAQKISNNVNQKLILIRADNIRALRYDHDQYKSLMQDVSLSLTYQFRDILPIIDTNQTYIAWCETLNSMAENILEKKNSAQEYFFGKKSLTKMQLFGQRVAIELIAVHIASGKLYNGRQPEQIPQHQLKQELKAAAEEIFRENAKKKKNLQI